jgi:hypothetical protein
MMIIDTAQTGWKRFTDQVKGLWSGPSAPVQQGTASTALPQSTTQSPHSDAHEITR